MKKSAKKMPAAKIKTITGQPEYFKKKMGKKPKYSGKK